MKPLFVICCMAVVGCGGHKEEEPVKPKAIVAVKTAVAETGAVQATLKAPATIFPREQANITPRMTGVIRELKVRKGDNVASGALLAVLENRDLVSQREEAQAMLADAQATLEKTSRGTIPADVERARGALAIATASMNQAKKIYDRRKALFDQGAIPERELLISETELSTARTNSEVAKKSLDLLEQQSRGQDIKIAEARVEQARSRLATMGAQLQYAELHAPFNGTITEQLQYAGDLGQSSSPIFTIADLAVVTARAQVPEGEAARVGKGQACAFRTGEGEGTEVSGRISVVNRAVDAQRRTVEVWCEIANPPQSLRSGSFGSVTINTARAQNALMVPVAALMLEEGTNKGHVMVIDEKSIAHKRDVQVGETVGGNRIVTSGLKAGETVITEGGYELPDNTEVTTGAKKDPTKESSKEAVKGSTKE